MGAIKEFMRLSQQNLAGMDEKPSAGPGAAPASAPPIPAGLSGGSQLLTMLQGRAAAPQLQQAADGPASSTPFGLASQMPEEAGAGF